MALAYEKNTHKKDYKSKETLAVINQRLDALENRVAVMEAEVIYDTTGVVDVWEYWGELILF